MTSAKRRTSKVRKYCSQHGLFIGFSWGGHRRRCQAKEVSEVQWYAHHKPPLLQHKTGDTAGMHTVEEVTKMADPKPKEAPISDTVKLIHGLRDNIFDLDSEISRLSALVKGAEEKLASLKSEREKIREAVKSLVK